MRPVDALLGQFVRACAEGDTRRAMGDETLRWQKIGAIRKAAGSILLAFNSSAMLREWREAEDERAVNFGDDEDEDCEDE